MRTGVAIRLGGSDGTGAAPALERDMCVRPRIACVLGSGPAAAGARPEEVIVDGDLDPALVR